VSEYFYYCEFFVSICTFLAQGYVHSVSRLDVMWGDHSWLQFFCVFMLLHCLLGLLMHDCFCYVRFRFFSTMLSNWLERTSLKWPIFVELDVKTWIVGISAVGCQKNTKFPVICQVILCNWSLVHCNMLTLSNIVYDNGDRLSASFNQMRWFGKNSNLSILGHRNMELSLYDH